jgi:hypothetical protein
MTQVTDAVSIIGDETYIGLAKGALDVCNDIENMDMSDFPDLQPPELAQYAHNCAGHQYASWREKVSIGENTKIDVKSSVDSWALGKLTGQIDDRTGEVIIMLVACVHVDPLVSIIMEYSREPIISISFEATGYPCHEYIIYDLPFVGLPPICDLRMIPYSRMIYDVRVLESGWRKCKNVEATIMQCITLLIDGNFMRLYGGLICSHGMLGIIQQPRRFHYEQKMDGLDALEAIASARVELLNWIEGSGHSAWIACPS